MNFIPLEVTETPSFLFPTIDNNKKMDKQSSEVGATLVAFNLG
jgi:hypothetical protein